MLRRSAYTQLVTRSRHGVSGSTAAADAPTALLIRPDGYVAWD
ncbi:hypothetical protein [Mycobacteroides salmoniphilum]